MAILICFNQGFREEITVKEVFEQAIEKVQPLQPPTSALEARTAATWRLDDGRETLIHPSLIFRVEQDHS